MVLYFPSFIITISCKLYFSENLLIGGYFSARMVIVFMNNAVKPIKSITNKYIRLKSGIKKIL